LRLGEFWARSEMRLATSISSHLDSCFNSSHASHTNFPLVNFYTLLVMVVVVVGGFSLVTALLALLAGN